MQWTLVVLAAAAIAGAVANARAKDEVPGYIQNWEKLYRGPPVPPRKSRTIIYENWIEQKLDNFNVLNNATWQMRYMVNNEYFQPGGPMIIYLGGEWEIEPGMITGGILYDLAKEHNATLIYTEHRYYGQSKPTRTLTVRSLRYLHVKQSLADLAHFIRYQRKTVPTLANAKVILAGGSYSASMVVWFKRLYPELISGGWASSGPLLAKVDFEEYMEVVGRALHTLGSPACYNRINNGTAELEKMIEGNRSEEAKTLLQLCKNFDEHNQMDIYSLFSTIANAVASKIQYQNPGDVPAYCNFVLSFDDDVTAVANIILYAYGYPQTCLNLSYKNTLNYYRVLSYANGGARPWFYQTCNEFGWFQSSRSNNQPFGHSFPVAFNTRMCRDTFGNQYSAADINGYVAKTNLDFGGMRPNVQNIYMTQGGLDPWNPMGLGVNQGATVIANASHCADFGSISNADSAQMRASKIRLLELVRQWLG